MWLDAVGTARNKVYIACSFYAYLTYFNGIFVPKPTKQRIYLVIVRDALIIWYYYYMRISRHIRRLPMAAIPEVVGRRLELDVNNPIQGRMCDDHLLRSQLW